MSEKDLHGEAKQRFSCSTLGMWVGSGAPAVSSALGDPEQVCFICRGLENEEILLQTAGEGGPYLGGPK